MRLRVLVNRDEGWVTIHNTNPHPLVIAFGMFKITLPPWALFTTSLKLGA